MIRFRELNRNEEEKAVLAVTISKELKKREQELKRLKNKGIYDEQKELIVEKLRIMLEGEYE